MDRNTFIKLMGAGAVGMAGGAWMGCRADEGKPGGAASTQALAPERAIKHWAWMGEGGEGWTLDQWKQELGRMREAGISAVLFHEGISILTDLIPAARQVGMEVHIWNVTMREGGLQETHPEWYVVNREGDSAGVKPAYVDYYKFMCPSREPVQQFLAEQIGALAQIEGVTSVHLDYIRYPDVILPVALWPRYNLVQDKEYPAFDYCYCDVCRAAFKEQTGLDPLELDDPPSHEAWLQYRYDTITRTVNRLAEVVHGHGKQLTAAVFPTPDIARSLVRQEWTKWNLDAVLPMIYHSFYNEPVAWVGEATREGVEALAGRCPLYSGLFVPELTPDELAQAAELSLANGAEGIVLFQGRTPTDAHWQKLAPVLAG